MDRSQAWISRIPTLEKLGSVVPEHLNASQVAEEWFSSFARCIGDVEQTLGLLCPDALWRDLLALTWDMRTFEGSEKIRPVLKDRGCPQMRALKRKEFVQLQRPYPDLVWIIGMFEFDVDYGRCSGVFRLVPTSTGEWKAFTVFTNLESLKGFPARIGALRSRRTIPGLEWAEERRKESEFNGVNPSVLIVGAGQSALSLAARLKYLGVPTLMIEKDSRIGDSWRRRYDTLCLHFPVWNDHMPYMPFPPTWPVYTPSLKMAEWLEGYAELLELNVWTSSTVQNAIQGRDGKWSVSVRRHDSTIRVFVVNHLVIAAGVGDGHPKVPDIPNKDTYKGIVFHSSLYKRASDYKGKKVIVIGAGNADVTMFQRSSTFVMNLDQQWQFLGGALYREDGPPLEISDRLFHSMPHLLLEGDCIAESSRDTLKQLRSVGFRVNSGIKEAGILLQLKEKAGGHYFDIGGSQLIIDGKIKLKNDSQIKAFFDSGLEFDNGSRLSADIIVFATGVGDMRDSIRQICGNKVADDCPPLLGVNEEGEMNMYRPLSRTGLWYMAGSFQVNRFFSNHLALQIKAMEEKIPALRHPRGKKNN
ncbi:hypothetical protein FPV67DRAFT_1561985 [Lyophyllum atratum]|nr:hypothetical protein FPV67DRAFT_1561985 [Lyophyllum atratum]